MKIIKIGTKVRVGGTKGPIETITEYNPKTKTYKLESTNCTGYICISDGIPLIPIKEYEQLKLF